MFQRWANGFAGGDIPHVRLLAGQEDASAIGAEGYGGHRPMVFQRYSRKRAGSHVPQTCRTIGYRTGDEDVSAVRSEFDVVHSEPDLAELGTLLEHGSYAEAMCLFGLNVRLILEHRCIPDE